MNSSYALVVDDHPLVARGIAEYLTTHCGYSMARTASGCAQYCQVVSQLGCPALVIVDFWLSDGTAFDLLSQIKNDCPGANLLAMSGDEDAAVVRRIKQAGFHGFVHKQASPETLARAVSALNRHERWFQDMENIDLGISTRRDVPVNAIDLGLTVRQGQILGMILQGLPNKKIAQTLSVSENTVKEHVTSIFSRLGVTSRAETFTLFRGRRIDS